MLLNTYFNITGRQATERGTLFEVQLMAGHPVYQGHFPGNPVSPGVCNMQMIKECAEQLLGQETDLRYIKQYRLMKVLSPQDTPHLAVEVSLDPLPDGWTLKSTVTTGGETAIDFNGTLCKCSSPAQ